MAAEWWQQRLDGIDPIEARQSARRFSEARGIRFRRAFRNIRSAGRAPMRSMLRSGSQRWETYVFPTIGNRHVGDIEVGRT
jgi:hypothetical protein